MNTCSPKYHHAPATAPVLIAAGLVLLLAQCWLPQLPAATALALIALGAILATIARLRHAASWRPTLSLSLFVYASLYLLFAGAILDGAIRGPIGSLALHQYLDLAASLLVMLFVGRLGFAALTAEGRASTP